MCDYDLCRNESDFANTSIRLNLNESGIKGVKLNYLNIISETTFYRNIGIYNGDIKFNHTLLYIKNKFVC